MGICGEFQPGNVHKMSSLGHEQLYIFIALSTTLLLVAVAH